MGDAQLNDGHTTAASPRKICIIGSGLSGLGYLNGLLDLPKEARAGWEIDIYERRMEAGGIWTPQANKPLPPEIPESPAYADLECLTMGSGMTFPNRPLPPSSLLFPRLETINQYIKDHIRHFDLEKYIHLGHHVITATLDGTQGNRYPWSVTIERRNANGVKETFTKEFSTIVVASGSYHTPRRLSLPGESDWLAAGSEREILHSAWFRDNSIGKNRVVVVVGNHPSGNHIARTMCDVAKEVHHVYVPDLLSETEPLPEGSNYQFYATRLDHYTANELVLADGTTIATPAETLVFEGTGYQRRHPFFPESVLHIVKGGAFDYDSLKLQSNLKYVRPLHKGIIPIDPSIPPGSLAFADLFPLTWYLPTSYAQGIWFGHLLADLDKNEGKSAILPTSAEASLEQVKALEERQRKMGMDMAKRGYFLLPPVTSTDDRSDELIREVRQHSSYALPPYLQNDPKREFMDPWRRRAGLLTLGLMRPWQAAKKEGIEASFTEGAETEADFAQAAEKLASWWMERTGLSVELKKP